MLYEYMNMLGYSKKEIELIRSSHSLVNYKEETLCNKVKDIFQCLLLIGYTSQEIKKMTKTYPSIYSYSVQNIESKIEDMIEIGYTKDEIMKMTKLSPQIYGFDIESMSNQIKDFVDYGFNKEDVIKMTKSFPALYNYDFKNNILVKIEELMKLGYSKEEVIKMSITCPSLYSHKINDITLNDVINSIIKFRYTREDAIYIIKLYPQAIGGSIKNLEDKLNYYDSIDLHDIAIINPVRLMQSVDLSYARYEFLKKEKKIVVTIDNFNKLFKSSGDFKKKYGITKKELLEKYNYQEYLEKQNRLKTV